MTKPNLSLIIVILDRSGSMASCRSDMEGGLNTFLEDQKKEPGECRLTFIQFDTTYETLADYIDLKDAPHFTLEPRGNTALYDAMGRTITAVGAKLASLPEEERPSNVAVCIVTDGQENASVEWTSERIARLVKQQSEQWGWNFTYLGANQTAINEAGLIGIQPHTSLTYNASSAQAVATSYAAMSHSVSTLRRTGAMPGYTSQTREDALRKTD